MFRKPLQIKGSQILPIHQFSKIRVPANKKSSPKAASQKKI
jgi:hypothetical protein